jgi:hypothetical protein
MKVYTSINIQGENFDVLEFEKEIGIKFSNKTIKGEIGKFGLYKRRLIPYGSVVISAHEIEPNLDLEYNSLDTILDFGIKNRKIIFGRGAESIHIDIAIYHKGICNWEITLKQIQKIKNFGSGISISCYKEEEL